MDTFFERNRALRLMGGGNVSRVFDVGLLHNSVGLRNDVCK